MPPLYFISSGRSVRKRLRLEKFVDYTHCCESSISFAVFSRHFKNVHSRNFLDLKDKNYKKAKMKGGLCWMKNYRE